MNCKQNLAGSAEQREVGPEAFGHVGFQGGRGRSLKKIYIYCTHLMQHSEEVGEFHLTSSWDCRRLAGSLAWPAAHAGAGHHLLSREGKLKSPVPTHTGQGQRSEDGRTLTRLCSTRWASHGSFGCLLLFLLFLLD